MSDSEKMEGTSRPDKIIINLDFSRSQAEFFRTLQHQLDIVTLLTVGAEKVSPKEMQPSGFHNFSPADNARLSQGEARTKAYDWLNSSFLRDSIEATDQFLGRCLSFCAAATLSRTELSSNDLANQLSNVIPKKYQKLHFPAKIAEMNKKYGVQPQLSEHVLSLNRVRTCLVHRLGKVTLSDTDEQGQLVAKWLTSQIVLRGLQTGTCVVLSEPVQLNEETTLEMHIVEHQKVFALGESVVLSPYDIFSTIFTLWRFGIHCAEAIEEFAVGVGIGIVRPETA